MAELTDTTADTTTSTCCAAEQQATCCEPSEKAGCCSGESSSCGCSAGRSEGEEIREAVRSRYNPTAVAELGAGETVLDPARAEGSTCCSPPSGSARPARHSGST